MPLCSAENLQVFCFAMAERGYGMDKDVTIILGEQGHVILTERRLSFWGLGCTVIRFDDGKGIIDFLTILKDADS